MRSCGTHYDDCSGLPDYPLAIENIYHVATSGTYTDIGHLINDIITNRWFSQNVYAPAEELTKGKTQS